MELSGWFAFHPFEHGPLLLGMKDIIENLNFSQIVNNNQLIFEIA